MPASTTAGQISLVLGIDSNTPICPFVWQMVTSEVRESGEEINHDDCGVAHWQASPGSLSEAYPFLGRSSRWRKHDSFAARKPSIPTTPDQEFLVPPCLPDWFPEIHLALFLRDVMVAIDLNPVFAAHE